MSLFRRLVAPELAKLESQNELLRGENEFLRGQLGEAAKLKQKAESALTSESKRNRLREDELLSQIIELAGGRKLSPREPAPTKDGPTAEQLNRDAKLSSDEETLLRQRAADYVSQTAPDTAVTAAMVEEAYQNMLKSPEYWLND
jgi:hypothetical protein